MSDKVITLAEVKERKNAILGRCNIYNRQGVPVSINQNEIKKCILEQNNIVFIDNVLHTYYSGVYMIDRYSKQTLHFIECCMEENLVTAQRKKAVLDLLQQDYTIEKDYKSINRYDNAIINFKNTMFNVATFEYIEHDREYISTIQIPHNLKKISIDKDIDVKDIIRKRVKDDKLHPNFSNLLLAQELKDDDIEMILQMIGVSMTKDDRYKSLAFVTGESDTGKSIFFNTIGAICGDDNISYVDIHDIVEDKFQNAEMLNKIVNIASDNDKRPITDTGKIKKLSGKDGMNVQKKHKDPIKAKFFATLWNSFNEMPILNDQSNAMYRRLRVVAMKKPVAKDKQDKRLEEKILLEIPEIIISCLYALHLAYKNGLEITDSKTSIHEKRALQENSDSVQAFINNGLELNTTNKIKVTECYNAYKEYYESESASGKYYERKNFKKIMLNKGYQIVKSNGIDMYTGIDIAWKTADIELIERFEKVVKRK